MLYGAATVALVVVCISQGPAVASGLAVLCMLVGVLSPGQKS